MFNQRIARLRSYTGALLSKVWHRLGFAGSVDDEVVIVGSDSECSDLAKITELYTAGLLPTHVAQRLVATALNLKECVSDSDAPLAEQMEKGGEKDEEAKGVEEDEVTAASAPGSVTG